MSDASTLPPEFYNAFGIDSASFQSAFQDSGNEMFSLRPGWSLGFTHAVLTTGDKPKTVASARGHPLEASAAGELWKKCTKGTPVTEEYCCVHNCTNPNCKPTSPQKAGASAHVYASFQTREKDIRFVILFPKCSADNHAGKCRKEEVNFAETGKDAYVLYTALRNPPPRVIFIEVSNATASGKGSKGKGKGEGGGLKGDYPPGPPDGALIAGVHTVTSAE